MRMTGLMPHARRSADHARTSNNLAVDATQQPSRPSSSSAATQRTQSPFHCRFQPPSSSTTPSHYVPSLYNNPSGQTSTSTYRYNPEDLPRPVSHGYRELYQDEVGITRYTPRLYNGHVPLKDGATLEGSREAIEEAERQERRPSREHRELHLDETGMTRYTPRLYNTDELAGTSMSRERSREGRREAEERGLNVPRVDAYGYVITDEDVRRAANVSMVQTSGQGSGELPPSYDAIMAGPWQHDGPRGRQ